MTELTERRITYGDFKRIYLPIGDWELEPPSEGIYDEPVFYYKANYKWAALIEGFVSWLTEITAWKNAEDENYSGIQSIMTFLERIVIEIDCAQVEDCLETSTIINNMITNITNNTTNISTNTTNITNVTNEVDVLQEQFTAKNKVPLVESYDDTEKCNAATYAANKIIAAAQDVFTQKSGGTGYGTWLINTLTNGQGWIGNALETLFDAVDGSYAATAAELAASNPYVVNALFGANLDRIEAKTAVLADTNISAHAKSIVAALLDGLTDGQLGEWAFLGKETSTGICSSTTTKIWDFTLGSQLGWVAQGTTPRATWVSNGWQEVTISGTGRVLVAQKSFTWPADLVLNEVRYYISNGGTASFNYVYGVTYANGTFNGTLFGSGRWKTTASIVKGTRTGIGVEHSIFTGGATRKLYRVEADYTGTASPDW